MSPSVHRSVGRYFIYFLKGQEVTPPCSYWSICFLNTRQQSHVKVGLRQSTLKYSGIRWASLFMIAFFVTYWNVSSETSLKPSHPSVCWLGRWAAALVEKIYDLSMPPSPIHRISICTHCKLCN